MLILPTTQTTDGKARAQKMLREVADQRVFCTMAVFGDGDRPREIASRADRRAENDPFRSVVYIPDVAVLIGETRFKKLLAKQETGEEAVALTIRFEISCSLHGADALDFFELEQAFNEAGSGTVEP